MGIAGFISKDLDTAGCDGLAVILKVHGKVRAQSVACGGCVEYCCGLEDHGSGTPGDLATIVGLQVADSPNGLAAISEDPAMGQPQSVAYGGFVEFSGGLEYYKSGAPGDLATMGGLKAA